MRQRIVWMVFVGLITLACKNEKSVDTHALTLGVKDSVFSNVLKEERRLLVYVPENASAAKGARYPVIYLLDGEAHFGAVTSMMNHMSSNIITPEFIIVAIPNTDRSRDLTPTHSLLLPNGSSQDFLKTTGGGEAFTSFLETELIPYIDKKYPTAPNRTLIGHSFGGLTAINILLNHPQIFDSYVAIDPSMWWDKQKLLHHADTVLKQSGNLARRTLFISVAHTMSPTMDTLQVLKDTTGNTNHIRSILHLAKTAQGNPQSGLRTKWVYYKNDDHGSVPFISEYDAMRFIFDYYRPVMDDDVASVESTKDHFKNVSNHLGYTVLPPRGLVNDFAYYLMMNSKDLDRAEQFFKLNLENYPDSPDSYYVMGDLYVMKGDTAGALKMYEKSASIKSSPEVQDKIKNLTK